MDTHDNINFIDNWLKIMSRSTIEAFNNAVIQVTGLIDKGVSVQPESDALKAFRLCNPDRLRCVILGQDPYPQKGVATGIAFANRKDVARLSPSLKIIKNSVCCGVKPAKSCIFDYTLESWERQGILLLNSALTVETMKPGSHAEIWKKFTSGLIADIRKVHPDVYWIAFGRKAWDFIDNAGIDRNFFKEYHPSMYARTGGNLSPKVWREMTMYCMGTFDENIQLYRIKDNI